MHTATRLLSKLLLLLVFAVALTTASALYLAIDREPVLRRAAEVTPANIKRAKEVLDQDDSLNTRSAARRSVTVSEQDLDLAANYLAHFYANGSARLTLRNDRAEVIASLSPPRFPVVFYFNILAVLAEGSPLPKFEQLSVGRLQIPGFMANWLIPHLMARLSGGDRFDTTIQMVKQIDLENGQVVIAYQPPSKPRSALAAAILSTEDQQRLRAYQERLALISNTAKGNNISLTELLAALFELANLRSPQANPVVENRAALLVLAFYVNGKPLAALLPAAKQWPRAVPQKVTLNGRDDFAKHFIVSAALAAHAGSPLADAVGVAKEIDDAGGGSGFSFNDIAADRAGSRFGERAAANAQTAVNLQKRLSAGIREQDIMPATQDLPEFMPEAEFKKRYGGVGAPAYNKMMADINRRVAALPFYR
ncbi:MAG: hypothetical protein ACM3TN_24340 [Alphaproteobacteria bacterium]